MDAREILLGKKRVFSVPQLSTHINPNYSPYALLESEDIDREKIKNYYNGFQSLSGASIYYNPAGIPYNLLITPFSIVRLKADLEIDFYMETITDFFKVPERFKEYAGLIRKDKISGDNCVPVGFTRPDLKRGLVEVFPEKPGLFRGGEASLLDLWAAEEFVIFRLGSWFYSLEHDFIFLSDFKGNPMAIVSVE